MNESNMVMFSQGVMQICIYNQFDKNELFSGYKNIMITISKCKKMNEKSRFQLGFEWSCVGGFK